jgi:hypothetical protein
MKQEVGITDKEEITEYQMVVIITRVVFWIQFW